MVTYSEKRFFEWHEDDRSVSLRAKSGSYGGGSEVLVIVPMSSAPSAMTITKAQTDSMSRTES